jgi:hypothetical protein
MTTPSWAELCGDLPSHQDEVMAASHPGAPSISEQDRTHGAGMPAEDRGVPDEEKYR